MPSYLGQPLIFLIFALTAYSTLSQAQPPKCSGVDQWATNMAFVQLKNSKITNNEALDFSKTKTVLIASEKIGDDLYRQVHVITFIKKSGDIIKVITVNDASNEECSMSGVQVYLINKELGD